MKFRVFYFSLTLAMDSLTVPMGGSKALVVELYSLMQARQSDQREGKNTSSLLLAFPLPFRISA